jgi:hypothetical protein
MILHVRSIFIKKSKQLHHKRSCILYIIQREIDFRVHMRKVTTGTSLYFRAQQNSPLYAGFL